jgi:hypothetical protein
MITAMRPYAGVPSNNVTPVVFTVTDTVALSSSDSGATGAEFANSRLGNFLSDDPAPRDRDLDSLFSSDTLPAYEKSSSSSASASSIETEGPLSPLPQSFDPISLPPLESALSSQMQQVAQDNLFRGISSGSFAQEMYTNTQDVLSRVAA